MNRKLVFIALLTVTLTITVQTGGGAVISADPSNYRARLRNLKPGDTLSLVAGRYTRLPVSGLNGTPDAWITITGPESGPPAVILEEAENNTVEIVNSSYVAIENLRIDSRGIPGASESAPGATTKTSPTTYGSRAIRWSGKTAGSRPMAFQLRTPTWGWVIRYNQILGAGTGLYLGDSDGTQPFVTGLIEHNLIKDTIGYNLEIKDQNSIPEIPACPADPLPPSSGTTSSSRTTSRAPMETAPTCW